MEKTKKVPAGDVLLHEYDPSYCLESKTVTNSSGSAMDLAPGYPMDDNVPIASTGVAGVDGILIQPAYIPDGESRKVAVLARGPATVNSTKLPAKDYAGVSFTGLLAALKAALPSVVFRAEPTVESVQTT